MDQVCFVQVVGPVRTYCAADGCQNFMVNADIWCIEHIRQIDSAGGLMPNIRNGFTTQYMWHIKKQGQAENKRLGWDVTGPEPIKTPGEPAVVTMTTTASEYPDCMWIYDDRHDKWDTQCDNAFQFNCGGPKDNNMAFCPYCGKPLKEQQR